MCTKSGIYAINPAIVYAVGVGQIIPLTQIVRRYGQSVDLENNAVVLRGKGYYEVDAIVNVAATASGPVTISLYQDGIEVPGAKATVTAAANADVVVPISALVRVSGCCSESALTLVSSSSVTTVNATMTALKA